MVNNQADTPLNLLMFSGRQQQFPKGQVIQFADNAMFLSMLDKGYIKRYLITDVGGQSIQSIYGPGDVFPLTPLFRALLGAEIYGGHESFYYESMTPVFLHSIGRETLEKAVADDPLIYKDLLNVAGIRLSSNIQRLENMSLKVAYRRVAHQLAYYSVKFGEKNTQGYYTVQLPLTHQDLANILNLARETVTHCMVRLEEKGLIRGDKQITVLDIDELQRVYH